ncbi:MAG: hypothetical protein GY714_19970 [Desulfobacterales bacterium]|nr:hypothetical protein [Desulfobacterales bacterium]
MRKETIEKINEYFDVRPQLVRPKESIIFGFITDTKMNYFLDFIVKESQERQELINTLKKEINLAVPKIRQEGNVSCECPKAEECVYYGKSDTCLYK